MGDPHSWWLNLTNALLGVGVLLFVLVVAAAALRDAVSRRAGSRTS